ncbi:MAG: AAA family ATPase [Xanthobacteraceae bacterium]|nr:AAA family ATPase [Xanthobacteraceae bacterium]
MTDQTAKPNPGPKVLGTRVSELKTCPLDWLWPGRIARAKLTLIGGPAGSGKSALATQLVAAVTTGGEWPCREGKAEQGLVVLVCPHGDPDIIAARLTAAGANLANVHLIHELEESDGPRLFNIATDLPVLDATIRTLDRVRAIIVDSINLPGGSSGADAARRMFEAFAALAKGHDIPVVVIGQAPGWESSGRKLASFSPAALSPVRSAFLIEIDPADEKRRLLLQVKNELGPDAATLAFRIAAHVLKAGQTAARIAFESEPDPASARHFFARQGRSFDSAKHEAVGFLGGLFGGTSELTIRQIENAAREIGLVKASQGLAQCRVLRDARLAMGLTVTRAASGADWVWAKPDRQERQLETEAKQPPEQIIQTAIVASPSLQAKQAPIPAKASNWRDGLRPGDARS